MIEYINAISKQIMKKFPKSPIYIEGEPAEFIRPSFYITLVAGDNDEMNRRLYKETVTFQIVYFGEMSEFGHPNVESQFSAFRKLQSLFNKGYIPVEDRVSKITNINLDKRQNEVYIDLTMYLIKPKDEEEESYEIMQELFLDTKRED